MTQAPTHPGVAEAQQVDIYREVHKGLRLALFELAQSAGSLDAGSPSSTQAFRDLFADIEMMLTTHHGHEDGEHLIGLITEHAPGAAVDVAAAHDDIDQLLDGLRDLVDSLPDPLAAAKVYEAVVRFVTIYLDHMRVEETVVMPALQQGVPAEDLTAITMMIRTSVPPPDMCVFLRYMLPAMNPDERVATLGGMKAGAPPEIFDLFWAVAVDCLDRDALATVAERIAA